MLAGIPVPNDAVEDLAALVRAAGADDLADRLERAAAERVSLLALTIDERAFSTPDRTSSERRAMATKEPGQRLTTDRAAEPSSLRTPPQ
jgi:hypothetical protein